MMLTVELTLFPPQDAVSGTAKQAVTYDYAQRLSEGYDIAADYLTTAVGTAISVTANAPTPAFITCPRLNLSLCPTSQSTPSLVILLYNPSPQPRTQRVAIPVASAAAAYTVANASGQAVAVQLVPAMANIARGSDSASVEVQFVATLPGLGFSTYFLTTNASTQADAATAAAAEEEAAASVLAAAVSGIASRAAAATSRPAWMAREVAAAVVAPADHTISNNYWTLAFDGTTGLLTSATDKSTGTTTPLTQNFLYYNSYQVSGQQNSGAYIFRPDTPNATAIPVTKAVTNFTTLSGGVVSEAWQVFGPWLTQIVRLTQGSPVVEFEWTVGHIPVDDGQGKEIISRFTTPIASNATWYTDSNGREFLKRVRNYRPTWQIQNNEPVSANYYPCNALGWLADGQQGMAVLVDRSQGCSSQQNGELEFMVHRRLLHDDGRGVGEPLNEPGVDGQGLTVTGSHYLLLAPTKLLAAQARSLQAQVFAPALPLIAPLTTSVSDYIQSHATAATILHTTIPANVDIMTLQVSELTDSSIVLLLRLAHRFGVGEDAALSQPAAVDLGALLVVAPDSMVELTLTGNQRLGAHKGYQWNVKGEEAVGGGLVGGVARVGASYNVTVGPAEIRTFNVTYKFGERVNAATNLFARL